MNQNNQFVEYDVEVPEDLQTLYHEPDNMPQDELSVHVLRMLNLHPALVRFRHLRELSGMSEHDKMALIEDMHAGLGLRDLRQ